MASPWMPDEGRGIQQVRREPGVPRTARSVRVARGPASARPAPQKCRAAPQGEGAHAQALTLDLPEHAKVPFVLQALSSGLVTITLNGEPYQLDGPVSVSTLLAALA